MLCANIIIRRQMYDGLVNFLLRCCFEEESHDGSSEFDALFKLNLFLEIFESFGVRETPLITRGWTHLSRALSECMGNLSAAEVTASLDASSLVILFGVISRGGSANDSKRCVPEAQVHELFAVAAQLYTSPYVDKTKQRQVASFVQHSVSFLLKICLVDSEVASSSRASSSKWLQGADYSGGANVMLQGLAACGGAMTDYSCFLVKTVLDRAAASSATTAGAVTSSGKDEHIETVTDFQKHLDMLCQLLELSFTCMEDFSVTLVSKIFASILSLLKHVTSTLEAVGSKHDREEDGSQALSPFAVLFHLIAISKILQAMHKLQLLHSQMSGGGGGATRQSFARMYEEEVQGGESQCAEAVKSALLAISGVGSGAQSVFSLMDFQEAVVILKAQALTLTSSASVTASAPSSVCFTESLLDAFPQYGRFSDAALFYSWTALSAGLNVLQPAHEGSSKQQQQQQSAGNFALSAVTALLERACAQLDLASAASVPLVLNSCLLLMQRAQTLCLAPATTESQREHATQLIGRMLEVAWTAVVSDDCLDYVTIQTFILLAFDTAALRMLDSSIQQVGCRHIIIDFFTVVVLLYVLI